MNVSSEKSLVPPYLIEVWTFIEVRVDGGAQLGRRQRHQRFAVPNDKKLTRLDTRSTKYARRQTFGLEGR